MKKIIMVATAALCLIGSAFAQENAGGSSASSAASGDMKKEKIAVGVVGAGILAAMVMNNRGNVVAAPVDPVCGTGETLVDGVCVPDVIDPPVCEAGEELVDGECVPVTTTTGTTTVTGTVTSSVTSTITTPVTVTATTTSL
jgi:hypothetical protein